MLYGDLYLVGGGDPYMTDERWWSFVQGLRERGLAKITGDVVIDNNYFAPITDSRGDFDAQPFRSYNVLPDALMVNFQSSRFTVNPFGQRSRPQIVVSPLPANLVLKNQVRLGTGRCNPADGGHRVRHARSHRSEHAGRARRVSGFMRRLLGDARDHDRAGLRVWNVSHDVDAVGRRDRRRGAPGAAAVRTRACCSSTTRCRSPRSSGSSTSSRTTSWRGTCC